MLTLLPGAGAWTALAALPRSLYGAGAHDDSFIFSDLLGNTKPQFSIFILLHNMFQPSGPDHMLNNLSYLLPYYRPTHFC